MQKNLKSWLQLFTLTSFLILSVNCTLLERRPPAEPAGRPGAAAPTEPKPSDVEAPPAGAGTTELLSPSSPLRPKRVGLIVGPGGAKALAAAGVIKELQRARIPIADVIGLEWGALVGGLFAQKGQSHDMEWKLYKLEKQEMPSASFLTSKLKAADIADLRNYLKDGFSQLDIQRSQIPFSCPSQSMVSSEWRWAETGEMAREVEWCLAYLPLYDVQRGRMAGAFAAEEAAQRLRKRGADLIVLINVLNSGNLLDPRQLQDSTASVILWQEIRRSVRAANLRVNEWIEVDTSKIGLNEFAKRKELFAVGEKAGQVAAKRLTDKYGF